MNKVVPALLSLFLVIVADAQPNSVELKTGATSLGSYGSVKDAYDAITAPVVLPYTIEMTASYNGSTEIPPVVLAAKAGANDINNITIRPALGVSAITLSASLSGATLLTLDDADYITIDGRPGGTGTVSALTLENSATGFSTNTIQLINGATHNVITYCKINNGTTVSSGRGISFGISVSNTDGNSDNLVSNCVFTGGRYVINSSGTAANPNTRNRIYGCDVVNGVFAGIWVQSGTGKLYVDSCRIYHTQGVNDNTYGILFDSQTDSAIITRNMIYDLNTGTSSLFAKGIALRSSVGTNYLYIYNNMINLQSSPASTSVTGIEVSASSATVTSNVGIYFNTVKIGGTLTGSGTAGNVVSSALTRTGTNPSVVMDIKNNIFVNERSGGTTGVQHVAMALLNPGGTNPDYNTYNNTSGDWIRVGTTVYNSFPSYQAAASGVDANSNDSVVHFVSATDLHLDPIHRGSGALAGILIPGITNDIDNDLRSSTPYRGADELLITVPLTLLTFNAVRHDNDVLLAWTTANEQNMIGYNIERSTDGVNFSKIGFEAAISSTGDKRYTFTDEGSVKITTRRFYYRLAMIDLNGVKKYSHIAVVEIDQTGRSIEMRVYPNPFTSTATISIDAPVKTPADISITDQQGRSVAYRRISLAEGTTIINLHELSTLTQGTYYVTVIAGERKTVKIVKQ